MFYHPNTRRIDYYYITQGCSIWYMIYMGSTYKIFIVSKLKFCDYVKLS